tara:strand:- start:23 stop:310 length:288 start_codon:yes stop_codon:yes gene_type:complete
MDLIFLNQRVVCEKGIYYFDESTCLMCQKNFEEMGLENRKNEVSLADGLDGTYSGWYFSGSIQNAIHSLKNDGRAKLGKELGYRLGIIFPFEEIE